MKYVELIGLPGAGKTTLLRSLKNRDFLPVSRYPFPLVGDFHRSRIAAATQKPWAGVLKELVLDSWSRGSLLAYPKLFSSILELVSQINSEERQRAIILNYWRNRLRIYDLLSRSQGQATSVIDEGLAQTLLSTLIRIPGLEENESAARGQIEAVVRNFPPIESIVHLKVSAEIVEKRSLRGHHWALHLTTSKWISLIVEVLMNEGLAVAEIEADSSPIQVRRNFLDAVPG